MKPLKENAPKSASKPVKVFKPLTAQQLEAVMGGPVASRGTVTNVGSAIP